MIKTVTLGLVTAASLSLAALTPALANYGSCTENPSSKGCPGYIETAPEFQGGVADTTMQAAPRHLAHVHSHQRYAPQKG